MSPTFTSSPPAAARAWAVGPIRLAILRNLQGRGSITSLLLSKGTFEDAVGAMYEYFDYSDWRLLRNRVTNLQRLDLYKRSVRHLHIDHPADPSIIAQYVYAFPFLRTCTGYRHAEAFDAVALSTPPSSMPSNSFRLYIHPGDPFGKTTATVVPSSRVWVEVIPPAPGHTEEQLECLFDYRVDWQSVVPKGIHIRVRNEVQLAGDTARGLLEAWPKGLGLFAQPLESLTSVVSIGMDKLIEAAAYVAYHRPSGIPSRMSAVETVTSTKQLRQLLKHCRGMESLDLSGAGVRSKGALHLPTQPAVTLGNLLSASPRTLDSLRALKHLTITLQDPRLSSFDPVIASMADFNAQAAAGRHVAEAVPDAEAPRSEPLALHSLTMNIAIPFSHAEYKDLVFGLKFGVVDTSVDMAQKAILDLVTPTRAHIARLIAFGGKQCVYSLRLALPYHDHMAWAILNTYTALNARLDARVQTMVSQEKARMRLERDGLPGTSWRQLSAEERVA